MSISPHPLKFKPRFVEKIWGGRKLQHVLSKELPPNTPVGESWELFDFPPGIVDKSADWVSSEIATGPAQGRTLHWAVREWGPELYGSVSLTGQHGQFPILIKFLDAREDLSVQVHPDQKYADANPGAHLKTEAWYVLQSDPGARLLNGLKPGVTRDVFEQAIRAGDVENVVNAVPAKPGDCFYLPSGTVHALGAGILVAEIQTPSDTTFRVFDFDRTDPSTGKPRQLHVEQALACIDFSARPAPVRSVDDPTSLVDSPFFRLRRQTVGAGNEIAYERGRPRVLIITEGVAITSAGDTLIPAKAGEVILLPAEGRNLSVRTAAGCALLDVEFPGR